MSGCEYALQQKVWVGLLNNENVVVMMVLLELPRYVTQGGR